MERFSIDDTHLLHPEGKEGLIVCFVFITFYFGIGVHVGIKVVSQLLLRDVVVGSKEEQVLSPKGILPVIKWLFTLGSTQDVTLEGVLLPLLEKTSVEPCHEVVKGEGTNKSLVGAVPVLDLVILNSHDDCRYFFVRCNFLMEKIVFASFTEISEHLGANLTTGEHSELLSEGTGSHGNRIWVGLTAKLARVVHEQIASKCGMDD